MDTLPSHNYMLTTYDNPYNPFEDFTSWFMFDVEKGYNTCGLLDRIANTTDDMTQREINIEIERAINEILKYDFTNVYIKVLNPNEKPEL